MLCVCSSGKRVCVAFDNSVWGARPTDRQLARARVCGVTLQIQITHGMSEYNYRDYIHSRYNRLKLVLAADHLLREHVAHIYCFMLMLAR